MVDAPPPAATPLDVSAAAQRLQGVAHRTPVITSRALDERCGTSVFLKCENFQRTGSFKFRGALNAVRLHVETSGGSAAPIVAFSSGNHAQAIALASHLHELPATIVMPHDAPAIKLAATRGYGAEVMLYDPSTQSREALAEELEVERGLHLIRAYDDARVIAGQGTVAAELHAEVPDLDLLLVCTGGGGLLAGSCLATSVANPRCRIVGVEPELADDAARSLRCGSIQTVHNPPTVADGARTPYLGKLNFEIIKEYAEDIVTVSEQSIVEAMHFVWQRLKIVVEPTGALALAALFEQAIPAARHQHVGVTISGGNVDLARAGELFRRFELEPATGD